MAVKIVMEPIFEADFEDCSFGSTYGTLLARWDYSYEQTLKFWSKIFRLDNNVLFFPWFCRSRIGKRSSSSPATWTAHGDARRLQIGAGGLTAYTGLLLDAW